MFSYVLNFYDFMVLTTAVVASLYIIPLLIKRDKTSSDLLLCCFLLSQGAISVNIVLLYNETIGPQTLNTLYPYHAVLLTLLYGTQGFLLLCYSKAMIGEPIKLNTKINIGGALFVLLIIGFGVFRIIQINAPSKLFMPWFWLVLPLSIVLGIKALVRLKRYDIRIRQRFSNIENLRLSWLWFCALGFVCVWGIVLASSVFGYLGNVLGNPTLHQLSKNLGSISNLPPMLLMSAMVVYGQTLRIKVSDISNDNKEAQTKPYKAVEEQKSKLEDLMLRVKIYQDPELRLDGLADSMGLSPRSVSALLNGYYQKNFYDFINYYRVLDAKKQLSNPEFNDKTIQRIFEDAGFNSKTTFNTLFKKLTGDTPSKFRKEHANTG
ncbi:MAG: helix-turn-helix domain-containing protein [Paraglaciecola sp.]|uniref:helix-turn-helix domain-containing protein n=1 Tax=Paraglaciecola sp. TaxID=1920173 RepID=UPI00329A16D5